MMRQKSRLALILAFVLLFGSVPAYGAENPFDENQPSGTEDVAEAVLEDASGADAVIRDEVTGVDGAVSEDAAGIVSEVHEGEELEEVGGAVYNLWIGGTQITNANKNNVPNLVGGSGTFDYDSGENKGTLTLHGNITAINRADGSYVISSNGIDLEVDASDATLCLDYADGKNYETGIWCRKDGENGGNLTVKGSIRTFMGRNSDEGLYSDKDMTIKEGSCLEFTGDGSDCMSTRNGSITIESGAYIYSSADATEMFDIRENLYLNGVVDMIGSDLYIMGNMEMNGGYLRIRRFSTYREIGRINVWRDVQLKDSIVDMEGPRSGALLDCNNLTVNGGKIHLKNTYNTKVLRLDTNNGKLNLSGGAVVKKPDSYSVQTKGTFPFNERTIIDNSTGNPATEVLIEGSGPLPQYRTVAFDGNGKATNESIPATQTVQNGGKAAKPVVPVSDEEFAFDGWYENKECTGAEFDFNTAITADKTLYAKWKSTKKYTVSFNYNDGSGRVFKTSMVISGDAVTSPKSYPEREGWLLFDDWYVDEHCTAPYDFSKPVNGNLNIYAGWTNQAKLWVAGVQVSSENHNNENWTFDLEKKELTLKKNTYYTEGSQLHFGDGRTVYIYAEDMDLTVKGNARFKYASSASGIGGIYVKGGSLTVDGSFTSEKMGYLIGAEKNVTVQGGKLEAKGDVYEARGIESGRDIVINGSTIDIDMSGAKTRGIYTGRGNITVNGGSVSMNLTGDDAYGINTDSGAIDLNDGHVYVKVSETGESDANRAIRAYGGGPNVITNCLDIVKPEGAVLASGKQYFKTSADSPVYEIELGEEPAPETVTVSFDMCGHGTQVPSQTVVRGGSAAWPENPSEFCFTFMGWYDNPDYYGNVYIFGFQVWNDQILYAKWEADPEKTRTVSFNMNGKGLGSKPADQTVAIGKKISRPEPDPVEEGWIFKGWYADEALTVLYDFDAPVTSDFALYAKWAEKTDASSKVVRFVMNGHGKQIEPVEVKEGASVAEPPEPVAEDCVFTGWYTDKECTKRYDFAAPVTEDLTLYAGWITTDPSKPFTISFTDRSSDPYTGIYYNAENKHYETVYTAKAIKPGILVTNAKGEIMKAGRDYTVKYSNNTKCDPKGNPAKVTVTGKGNYSGKRSAEFFILKADLEKLQGSGLLVVPAQYVKKGGKPAPVLYYGAYRLGKKDFDLSDAGKLTEKKKLDITGKGNFEGTLKGVEFKALEKSEIAKLTVKARLTAKEHVYDGKPQTLISGNGELAVTDGEGKALTEGKDYTLTYIDNVNAGRAQVIVRGIGTYLGSSAKAFKIKPDTRSEIKAATVSQGDIPFLPGGVEPRLSVTVSRDGAAVKLRESIDYTIKYAKNKGAGTGKYAVSLLGNYKGHAVVKGSFTIINTTLDADRTTVSSPDIIFKKPGKCFSKPYVTYDSVLLKEKKDYTVKYYTDEALSQELKELSPSADSVPVYVKITGTGNFEGEAKASYMVSKLTDKVKYDLSKARIVDKETGKAVPKQEYTGNPVQPPVKVQVKSGREWVDVPESVLEITYLSNVQKGKAVVMARAKTAEAAGSVTGKFSIATKGLNQFKIMTKKRSE
ncbi:MAG: InlB B-repeat-containing protein [Lachnospiraceae bacterium]|nr:InlB B-repeat-containing protein [Lachnospiraceae bacterium]